MVVQSAEDRQRKNAADSMDGSGSGRVLGQREVCSGTVVVMRVRAQHVTQMTVAEHDHMIKAFASDRADQSFGIAVLPWRSRRCRSVANAHRANAARKCLAVDPIPIPDEVLGRALPTACLRDLPGDCVCRKLDPDIMVVQSAENRQRENASESLDGSRQR